MTIAAPILDFVQRPCPNFGYPDGTQGRGGQKLLAIVNHIAQGTRAGIDNTFSNGDPSQPGGPRSAHFGVMRDGAVHQYVRDEDAAWGAGLLDKPDETLPWLPPSGPARGQQVNQRVISIEHEGFSGEPLTPEQLQATVALHRYLVQKWSIPVDRLYIVGHYCLNSVSRQGCPGPAFPWDDLLAALKEGPVLSPQATRLGESVVEGPDLSPQATRLGEGLVEGAVIDKQRVQQALDVIWGWSERLAQLSAAQAAKELKDAVVAVKEEIGL